MTYLACTRQRFDAAIMTGDSPVRYCDAIRAADSTDTAEPGEVSPGAGPDLAQRRSDLCALGFLRPAAEAPGGFRLAADLSMEAVLPCIGMMDRIRLALVPLASQGCPVEFCSGFLDFADLPFAPAGQGPLIAVGQGMSRASASLACLGEMAERLSILSRGETDPLIDHTTCCDLPAGALINFSSAQQSDLVGRYPDLAAHFDGRTIDWDGICDRRVRLTALHGDETAFAASLACLLREGAFFKAPGAPITSSNGAASWWRRDGALERAVMELIERDTVACWWYNRLVPARIDLDAVRHCLAPALAGWFAERQRRTHFLRLAVDLDCSVFAAVSVDRNGRELAYGFKAACDPQDAVRGAALEMVQMEMHLQTICDTRTDAGQEAQSHPLMRLSRGVDVADHPWLAGFPEPTPFFGRAVAWPRLLDQFADRSIPLWAFDATRDDVGVPTQKVVSPVLRDWSARFAAGRLFSLPVSLGLRSSVLQERDLNPLRLVA